MGSGMTPVTGWAVSVVINEPLPAGAGRSGEVAVRMGEVCVTLTLMQSRSVPRSEPAVPTLYPSPSVTDAVIVPSGLVGAVGTVRIAVPDSASIVIVAVAGSSSASSTPVFLYATCTVRSAIGAGEAFTVYDTGCPASTVSESARIVTVLSGWGASRGHSRSFHGRSRSRFGNLRRWRRTATSRKRERDERDQHEQPVRQIRARETRIPEAAFARHRYPNFTYNVSTGTPDIDYTRITISCNASSKRR